MKVLTLRIRFLTPAFLGDAEQKSAWRTPPFKAQLRQWWRIEKAAERLSWEEIRRLEGELFGHARPDGKPRRSQVRLRLDRWRPGQARPFEQPLLKQTKKSESPAPEYLAYGPFSQRRPAIDAGDGAELRLAVPEERRPELERVLGLMHRFGTVGSSSRNGWGAYALEDAPEIPLERYLIDWREALEESWVRGIGKDEQGPLIWRTSEGYDRWHEAMKTLAELRKKVNSVSTQADLRCLVSYPVTKMRQQGWRNSDRLPGTLRFKVLKQGEQYYGQAVHLPCRPNDDMFRRAKLSRDQLWHLWRNVHRLLDGKMQRVAA
ncbi:MAG: hypothetical protein GX093_09740 [Xanthomonadaceae bacterium]|nr:hypothetical protein [Xanthomonadaceae bacterium]